MAKELLERKQKIIDSSLQIEVEEKFPPSYELAWTIGILAGGGSVGRQISFDSPEKELLEYYRLICESHFHLGVKTTPKAIGKDGKLYERNYFQNRQIAILLGDLRRTQWPRTILDQHQWILQNQRYTWGLLEGYFEPRGRIDTR